MHNPGRAPYGILGGRTGGSATAARGRSGGRAPEAAGRRAPAPGGGRGASSRASQPPPQASLPPALRAQQAAAGPPPVPPPPVLAGMSPAEQGNLLIASLTAIATMLPGSSAKLAAIAAAELHLEVHYAACDSVKGLMRKALAVMRRQAQEGVEPFVDVSPAGGTAKLFVVGDANGDAKALLSRVLDTLAARAACGPSDPLPILALLGGLVDRGADQPLVLALVCELALTLPAGQFVCLCGNREAALHSGGRFEDVEEGSFKWSLPHALRKAGLQPSQEDGGAQRVPQVFDHGQGAIGAAVPPVADLEDEAGPLAPDSPLPSLETGLRVILGPMCSMASCFKADCIFAVHGNLPPKSAWPKGADHPGQAMLETLALLSSLKASRLVLLRGSEVVPVGRLYPSFNDPFSRTALIELKAQGGSLRRLLVVGDAAVAGGAGEAEAAAVAALPTAEEAGGWEDVTEQVIRAFNILFNLKWSELADARAIDDTNPREPGADFNPPGNEFGSRPGTGALGARCLVRGNERLSRSGAASYGGCVTSLHSSAGFAGTCGAGAATAACSIGGQGGHPDMDMEHTVSYRGFVALELVRRVVATSMRVQGEAPLSPQPENTAARLLQAVRAVAAAARSPQGYVRLVEAALVDVLRRVEWVAKFPGDPHLDLQEELLGGIELLDQILRRWWACAAPAAAPASGAAGQGRPAAAAAASPLQAFQSAASNAWRPAVRSAILRALTAAAQEQRLGNLRALESLAKHLKDVGQEWQRQCQQVAGEQQQQQQQQQLIWQLQQQLQQQDQVIRRQQQEQERLQQQNRLQQQQLERQSASPPPTAVSGSPMQLQARAAVSPGKRAFGQQRAGPAEAGSSGGGDGASTSGAGEEEGSFEPTKRIELEGQEGGSPRWASPPPQAHFRPSPHRPSPKPSPLRRQGAASPLPQLPQQEGAASAPAVPRSVQEILESCKAPGEALQKLASLIIQSPGARFGLLQLAEDGRRLQRLVAELLRPAGQVTFGEAEVPNILGRDVAWVIRGDSTFWEVRPNGSAKLSLRDTKTRAWKLHQVELDFQVPVVVTEALPPSPNGTVREKQVVKWHSHKAVALCVTAEEAKLLAAFRLLELLLGKAAVEASGLAQRCRLPPHLGK